MQVVNFTPLPALVGGLVIGIATAAMWLLLGRITGISGIAGGLVARERGDVAWRGWFVAGMVVAGAIVSMVRPAAFAADLDRSWAAIVVAGLLVGVGTQLANGCTSGHGICGLGRGAPRSIVATLTFMATGMLVAGVVTHAFGGAL
jgi:hypothetical protein